MCLQGHTGVLVLGIEFDAGEVKSLMWDIFALLLFCPLLIRMLSDQLEFMLLYEPAGLFCVMGPRSTMSSVMVVEVLAIQLVIHQHLMHDVASEWVVDKLQYPLCVYLLGMLAGTTMSVCVYFCTHD